MTRADHRVLLDEHRAAFEELERRAERSAADRHDEEAVSLCQLAGRYAWANHPGVFTSPLIEETLATIGGRTGHHRRRAPRGALVERVLHVMTTPYRIGGHTRLVQRWAELDSSRLHSLALTAARPTILPGLRKAIWERGGEIYRLAAVHRQLLHRARALRDLAESFDVVVVHTHPFDVVPSLAFAGNTATRVGLLNHADHVFWIGTHAADRILNLRAAGANLSIRRRGASQRTSSIVPIPLSDAERRMDRTEAKKRLGLSADDVLVVTMANAYKFTSLDGDNGFLDHVAPALLRHDRCVLIAIGPSAEGQWSALEASTHGRLRAVGRLTDPSVYLDAADLYADSFPFSSLTSLLEAGARGTPLLAYTPPRPGAEVLGPDDPALLHSLVSGTTAEEFARLCAPFMASPALRSEVGTEQQRAIEDLHTGAGWVSQVESAYRALVDDGESSTDTAPHRMERGNEELLDQLLVHLSDHRPLSTLIARESSEREPRLKYIARRAVFGSRGRINQRIFGLARRLRHPSRTRAS